MPEPKALTRTQARLLEAAESIWSDRATEKDAAFMARQLVQATLPHKNPRNAPLWKRTNGNLTLAIQPGIDIRSAQSYGYPYGKVPRLLLFWMTTEAVRTKSRRLELGHTLSDFMLELGLNPDNGSMGAKRSDARRLREQVERLFRARISFQLEQTAEQRTGYAWLDMQVAQKASSWDYKNSHQSTLWVAGSNWARSSITPSPRRWSPSICGPCVPSSVHPWPITEAQTIFVCDPPPTSLGG